MLLHEVFGKFDKIITIEDGCVMGGIGSAILEFAADHQYKNSTVVRLGIPDAFIEHGTQMELHKECGFDPESIAQTAAKLVGIKLSKQAV